MGTFKFKLLRIYAFFLARISEQSTWQAIGFCVGLFGGKFLANMDTGSAAAFGGLISAFLKAIFPEPK